MALPGRYQDWKILETRTSGYADIFFLGQNGNRVVAKRIKQHGKDASELLELSRVTEQFRSTLQSYNVPVPDRYEILDEKTCDGLQIWHIAPYAGIDYSIATSRNLSFVKDVVIRILRHIEGLLTQSDGKLGLDPRLSNFAGRNTIYFDLFPPLIVLEGKPFVHYPNPDDDVIIQQELQRKFTPEGIIRRLRFELMLIDPKWDRMFHDCINQVYREPLRSRLLHSIDSLPDNAVNRMCDEAIFDFIDRCMQHEEVDSLREIAARLLSVNGDREQRMHDVFHLTSQFHSSDLYPKDRMDRLNLFRNLITQQLQCRG